MWRLSIAPVTEDGISKCCVCHHTALSFHIHPVEEETKQTVQPANTPPWSLGDLLLRKETDKNRMSRKATTGKMRGGQKGEGECVTVCLDSELHNQ